MLVTACVRATIAQTKSLTPQESKTNVSSPPLAHPEDQPVEYINGVPVYGRTPKKDARYWTEWNLENWARVLSAGGNPEGLPKSAMVGENYTSLDLDGDSAYQAMCYAAADTTSMVINGLPDAEMAAIRHRYLGEFYDFEALVHPFGIALALAIPLVTEGLRRRGAYLGD